VLYVEQAAGCGIALDGFVQPFAGHPRIQEYALQVGSSLPIMLQSNVPLHASAPVSIAQPLVHAAPVRSLQRTQLFTNEQYPVDSHVAFPQL